MSQTEYPRAERVDDKMNAYDATLFLQERFEFQRRVKVK